MTITRKDRKAGNNVIFIDASVEGHLIKEGNQNALRDDDIENIVSTYRARETKDKYSDAASVDELVDDELEGVNTEVAGYCRELRIAVPFAEDG